MQGSSWKSLSDPVYLVVLNIWTLYNCHAQWLRIHVTKLCETSHLTVISKYCQGHLSVMGYSNHLPDKMKLQEVNRPCISGYLKQLGPIGPSVCYGIQQMVQLGPIVSNNQRRGVHEKGFFLNRTTWDVTKTTKLQTVSLNLAQLVEVTKT
jgi:hypothetical protein